MSFTNSVMKNIISFSFILVLIFGLYAISTIWTLAEIFIPPKCDNKDHCFDSHLKTKPKQSLVLYTSISARATFEGSGTDAVQKVHTSYNFNYLEPATL